MMTSTCHPFEARGLGNAPFRFAGMYEKVYCAGPGCPQQPAGTCDYCGMGIRYCCQIQSADGKEFIVGCDCVRKLDREDNRLASEVERAKKTMEAQKRAARKAARMPTELARIQAARDLLESKRVALACKPHPVLTGRTLADYVDYLNKWASHSGLLRMSKIIEEA